MSRVPSEATQIKNLKRELAQVRADLAQARIDASTYRVRATKAEQDVAEWKERFDLLLRLKPEAAAQRAKGVA